MSNKIEVILAKANWCPHCTNFMPVFEKSTEDYGKEYEFSYYDFADDAASPNKSNFDNDHGELSSLIEGYPTVFVKINKSHTQVNPTIITNNNIDKAVKDFIKNIQIGCKTIMSGGKVEHINLEGGSIEKNIIFKNKYMKYKEKYFKLKNNL
jgi:thiol-disulfide isomerase/thioredoxin